MGLTQVSTAGVKDDAVTAGKIPANAVGASELADNAVDTAAIADDAVTADKLANAINTDIAAKAALTGSTNNTVCTVTGANAIAGEANLTFDGNDLTQTIDADAEGFDQTAAGNHYIKNIATSVRTSAGAGIWNQTAKWNTTEVAAIKMQTGPDTTNKDDGIINFHTTAGGTSGERMRIDQHGRVIKGSTSSHYSWGENPYSQLHGTDFSTSGKTLTRWSNDASPPWLLFNKSRGGIGTQTTVQAGDGVGGIGFIASDGTDFNNDAARITTYIDGTPASNVVPGRIKFATTKANGQPTWKLDIRAGGDVEVMEGHLVLSAAAKGINFHPHGAGGANTLDDYEEGSHTAVASDGALYSGYNGISYVKVGSQVTCAGQVRVETGHANQMNISLPFTSATDTNDNSHNFVGSLNVYNVVISDGAGNNPSTLCCQLDSNSSTLQMKSGWDSGAWGGIPTTGNGYFRFTITYQAA